MLSLEITTTAREEMTDITEALARAAAEHGRDAGALLVFCAHTTCGLTINEGADPDVRRDLVAFFQELAPRSHGWRHAEGNTDAHIRASLLGAWQLIPLEDGRLCLGTWQHVFLYEGDGPRRRRLWLQFLAKADAGAAGPCAG